MARSYGQTLVNSRTPKKKRKNIFDLVDALNRGVQAQGAMMPSQRPLLGGTQALSAFGGGISAPPTFTVPQLAERGPLPADENTMTAEQQAMKDWIRRRRAAESAEAFNAQYAGSLQPAQNLAASVAQPAAGMGDPTLGRHVPSVFSTSEGGFGAEKVWQPEVGSIATALTPETAAYIGPETQRQMAYAPEALAELETKAAEARKRLGIRGESDVYPEADAPPFRWTQATADAYKSNRAKMAMNLQDAGRVAGPAPNARAIELEKRNIRLAAKREGAPVSDTLAKIQAKSNLGVELTPGDEKTLADIGERQHRQQLVRQVGPEAAGRVIEDEAKMKNVADLAKAERDWKSTSEGLAYAQAVAGGEPKAIKKTIPGQAYTSAREYIQTLEDQEAFDMAWNANDWDKISVLLDKNEVPNEMQQQLRLAMTGFYGTFGITPRAKSKKRHPLEVPPAKSVPEAARRYGYGF